MPINPNNIIVDKKGAKNIRPNPSKIEKDGERWIDLEGMETTMRNVGTVYPMFEVAANMITSTYGVPISGLVGLAMLPFGADKANEAIKATQKYFVYEPKTREGQILNQAANYPFQKLEEGARFVGEKLEKSGHPYLGLAAETGIVAGPAMLGLKGLKGKSPYVTEGKIQSTIESGINKGVRPSVIKKEVYGQRRKYMENAKVAVREIINNKEKLELLDRDGNVHKGLPRTLEEFSQSIEQTKSDIFKQYDGLARQADQMGARVNLIPVIRELEGVINNNVLQTMSPETVKYANARLESLRNKSFSTMEAQQAIQILNESQKAYYANPSPATKGTAYVDSLIANNLRAGLDFMVEAATGLEYQPLKRKYGALRMLETDVTKRAIVDARKNIKGLIDFSDVFSSSQLIYGLFSKQPASVLAGATAKSLASYIKYINDPNRIIKNMFKKTEKKIYSGYKQKIISPMIGIETSILTGKHEGVE